MGSGPVNGLIMKPVFRKKYEVSARLGENDFIHLLPAQLISQAARAASGEVSITCGNATADAKDVFQLIRLKAGPGALLTISARDRKDAKVADDLAALVSGGFGEK